VGEREEGGGRRGVSEAVSNLHQHLFDDVLKGVQASTAEDEEEAQEDEGGTGTRLAAPIVGGLQVPTDGRSMGTGGSGLVGGGAVWGACGAVCGV
jgi:hypothetical protein